MTILADYTSADIDLYRVVNKINAPQIEGNLINMAGNLLHSYTKPYKELSEKVQSQLMLF